MGAFLSSQLFFKGSTLNYFRGCKSKEMQQTGGTFLEDFVKLSFIAKASGLSCNLSQQLACTIKAEILLGETGRLIKANC